MSLYEKKNKDPLTKGAATPANGSINELDDTNIERKHAKRYLSWTCVVYPCESLPENWKSILGDLMVSWAISPLHDQDVNADGEKKKAHRHLLLSFRSVKSYAQIEEITSRLGAPAPQPCYDTRALVRYFLHMDNPEKAQYKRENIEFGGGFDLENALKASASEEQAVLHELCEWIRVNTVCEFCDVDEYVRTQRKEWCFILDKKTYYLNSLCRSQKGKYFDKKNNQSKWGNT